MAKKTTEQLIAAAKAAGVEVRVTQRPKGGGEIMLLPGVRPRHEDEFDEFARERDDDGSGVDE